MKQVKRDWKYLGEGMLLPGASLVVTLIALVLSNWFHDKQQSLHEEYSSNLEAIHDEYDALVYRRLLTERYYRRYKEFQDLGFVGRERRLDWVQTIRASAKSLDLPSVSYSVEPQLQLIQPVRSESPNAKIQIFGSQLELKIGLIHELDLLRFFDRLEGEAPGLMRVDRCDLARQREPSEPLVAATNILASCSMKMFSVITSDVGAAEAGS